MNENHYLYDATWMGKIPPYWSVKKIGALFTERRSKVSDKDYPPLSVAKFGVVPQLSTAVKTSAGDNRKLVCTGDFVINSRSDRKGSCGVSSFDGSVSLVNIVLTPRFELDANYVHYLLRSQPFAEEFYRNGKGIVADLWTTRFSEMKPILLPIPPRSEQDQIVKFLDWKVSKINKLINIRKKQIEKLEELKKSIVSHAVTHGLDPNVEMKDSGVKWIGKIPSCWKVRRLKYFVNHFYKGNGITKEDVTADGNTPCVRYGEIYSKYNNSFNHCFSYTNLDKVSTKRFFSYGDILFAGTGELIEEIGKNIVYLGNELCLAGGDIIVAKHQQNPSFLNYALNSTYAQSQKSSDKIKLKVVHISALDLGNILVALPDKKEQKIIAKYLDEQLKKIDSAISNKKAQIEKLHELKTSLISDVVTGKIDVRGIEIPEYESVAEDVATDIEDIESDDEIEEQDN